LGKFETNSIEFVDFPPRGRSVQKKATERLSRPRERKISTINLPPPNLAGIKLDPTVVVVESENFNNNNFYGGGGCRNSLGLTGFLIGGAGPGGGGPARRRVPIKTMEFPGD